jgi:hypothetical protein
MDTITDQFCFSLWGSEDCSLAFLPVVGASGGILSMWSKVNSNFLFSFVGEGYVGVCLEWGMSKTKCYLLNIYSKCDLASKRILWSNIISIKEEYGEGNWCVLGDFNAVVVPEERVGA